MVKRAVAAVNAWVGARVGRRFWVWAALLAGLAVVLDFVPLFDVLGYDFAFALGLAAAFAAVDLGHGVVARARAAGAGTADRPRRLVAPRACTALAAALAVLVPPLLLSLANGAARARLQPGRGARPSSRCCPWARPSTARPRACSPRRSRRAAGACSPWRCPCCRSRGRSGACTRARPSSRSIRSAATSRGRSTTRRCGRPRASCTSGSSTSCGSAPRSTVALAAVGRGRDPRRLAAPRAARRAAARRRVGRCSSRRAARSASTSGAAISRPTLDRTLRTEHFVVHYAASSGKTPADSRAAGGGLRVPLPPARRDAGRRARGPRHRLGVPERRRQEGPRGRGPHAVRQALDARDLPADRALPVVAPAPRARARVRGRLRRPAVRHRVPLDLARPPARARRSPWGSSRASPRRPTRAIPTARRRSTRTPPP